MNAEPQGDRCRGCAISQMDCSEDLVCRIRANGDIVPLEGGWILHHYVGEEGFLGWLALQPREHRQLLSDLSDDEANSLGGILRRIEDWLTAYWRNEFPDDPLEHVYVAYFQESSKHFHLHIVPRPKSFKDLHACVKACDKFEEIEGITTWPHGWHVYLATKFRQFPDKYRRDEQKSKKLMEFLRTKLLPAPKCGGDRPIV